MTTYLCIIAFGALFYESVRAVRVIARIEAQHSFERRYGRR
jgi:hypothetical protein